jgi:uncharacterized membrane protein
MSDIEQKSDPEKKQVLQLYAAFGAALVLCIIPFFFAAFISFALFLGVLIAAYILRGNAKHGDLLENHTTYVIRTIWIGSLFAVLTMILGSVYLFLNIDNTPLDPCIQHFLNMQANANTVDMMALAIALKGCSIGYIGANFKVFLISFLGIAGPILLYFIVRYARGLSRALSGYRVNKPLGWF